MAERDGEDILEAWRRGAWPTDAVLLRPHGPFLRWERRGWRDRVADRIEDAAIWVMNALFDVAAWVRR